MERLDAIELTNAMTEAASAKVACWRAFRFVAASELGRLARTLEDIRQLYADGAIEEDEAYRIAATHTRAALTVLRASQCVGAGTARRGALRILREAIHAAQPLVHPVIGFPLIAGLP